MSYPQAAAATGSAISVNSNTLVTPITAAYLAEVKRFSEMQIAAADGVADSIMDSYTSTRTLLIELGLLAIVVGADTDNTHGNSLAYVDALALVKQ